MLVWKLDRFARNRYDSAKYKLILKKNGVKVISATEAISEGAEGIILESVLEGMAEYYSADLAEKVSRGMTENALKCKYNGGMCVPFGYRIDEEKHFQLNPVTAPVASEIFTRYVGGETVTDIISDLNSRGMRTARGVLFNKNSLRNMLHNRNYIGEYHYREIVVPGGVPAIVSAEVFEKAEARLNANKRTAARFKAKEKYILTTKLFCGECHTMMIADSANKSNGNVYRYYKCASAKRHECKKKPVRKELIEDAVVAQTLKYLSDDDTMKAIVKQIFELLNEDNVVIPALESQLKEVRKAIENIVKAIEAGVFSRSTKVRLEELETEEERLKENIQKEKLHRQMLTEEQVWFMLDKYRNMDMTIEQNRERLIDGLVGSILLYDDGRVIITFNYKSEPVTISLDEIVSAAKQNSSDTQQLVSPQKHLGKRRGAFALTRQEANSAN